jgi:membrane protease YdiL (CAAX protease family)
MRDKLSKKHVLYLSLILIIGSWVYKFVQVIFYPESLHTEMTMQELFWLALVSKVGLVILVSFLFWLGRETYADIGFRKQNLTKQILYGLLFGLGIWIVCNIVVATIMNSIFESTDIEMGALFASLLYIPLWIVLAFLAGFSEELVRIFMLTRFEMVLGRAGLILVLILNPITFGLAHLYQGMGGVVISGFSGLLFGLVYLRKRSAIEVMVSHTFYDLIGITLGFLISLGG